MVALTLFVSRTQLGRAMRAVSFDRQAAEMMGIDVNRVIAATFFIGSALAGAAGVFNGLVYQNVWAYMGFDAGLKASPPRSIGGHRQPAGRGRSAASSIGLAESFTIGYVSSTFSDAIVFVILIAVMILRPSGLLGRAGARRRSERAEHRPTRPKPPSRSLRDRRRRLGRLGRGPPRRRQRRRRRASGSQVDRIPHPACFVALHDRGRPASPLFTSNGYILRVGFDTLIYMLLALGLNIVVGFAGLLDLGYVAFFGFGAYGYAMLASSQFDLHWPTLAILVRRHARDRAASASSWRSRRAASSATTSRS